MKFSSHNNFLISQRSKVTEKTKHNKLKNKENKIKIIHTVFTKIT